MSWLTRLRVVVVVLTGGGPASLTDWWGCAPDWAVDGLRRLCGLDWEHVHDWLCPALGCRCPEPAAAPTHLDAPAAAVLA